MKQIRLLTLLALLMTAATGAWAQEQSETIATTAKIVEGTHFTIDNHGNYADDDGMNAQDDGITVTPKNGETITKVVISCTWDPDDVNDGNTSVSSGTKEITNGGGTITVTGVNASTFTFTCSDVGPQFVQFVVYYTETPAAPAGYTVTMKDGVKDADKWTITPNTGLKQGDNVTVTYTGSKKVIGVKAEKKAAPKLLEFEPMGVKFYYYEGETWGEAIRNHPENQANGWYIEEFGITVMYKGRALCDSAHDDDITKDTVVNPNGGYLWGPES